MKKIFIVTCLATLSQYSLLAQTQRRPEKCGMQTMHQAMIAEDPSWEQKLNDQRNSRQAAADYYLQYKATHTNEKTTAISAVPVIFHIIVDSSQFIALGGTVGIIKRCDSQIAVLNADYNQENTDSTLIPTLWKPLYGNVGIHFGLARIDPGGACSPGYEIKILPGATLTDTGYSDINNAFPEAKTASTGLAAWDVTRYYNVWCINFTGAGASLLGITVPKSEAGTTPQYEGVCILYNTLGSTGHGTTPPGTGTWPTPYNLGRTLTHETGHFFEIWHPWGDDNGKCPGWSSTATVEAPPATRVAGMMMA